MSRKHWSADHHEVRQWSGDGQSVSAARKAGLTFAIVVPVLLAVGAVALAVSGGGSGKQLTAFALRNPGDVATAPVDGAGNAINMNQTAAQAAASMNCGLAVPANPLTAPGLATPYQLGDGCVESNVNLQAFVEATILSPNGQLQVYNPLVVTQGTQPAVAPVVPQIARGSQVVINIGFNGTNLFLTGPGALQGHCKDALGQSLIGQVSACNAAAFFRTANAEIAQGTLKIPAAGTAKDGQPCIVTRNFALIDQDQSDNVVTSYLVDANGQTAQNTTANAAAMAGGAPIVNGSDDKLLTAFVDPALGCTPLTAPSVTTAGGMASSQALNELSAAANSPAPAALVPPNDEMVLVGGQPSIAKTNVYRSLVDQPALPANANPAQVEAMYCQNMVNLQPTRSVLDMTMEAAVGSPVAAVGTNLATFLGNRLSMSFTNLGCAAFGLKNPVTATLDAAGAATAVTYGTTQQTANLNGTPAGCGTPAPTAAPTGAGSPTASPVPTAAAPSPTASAAPTPCPTSTAGGTPGPGTAPTASGGPAASASPVPTPSPTFNRRHRGRHRQDPSGE